MHFIRRTSAVLLAASLLALTVASDLEAGKQLRWKLNAGDKFEVKSDQKMEQTISIGGQTMEIPQTVAMHMTWVVESVNTEGTATIAQTIDRIVMIMDAPGQGEIKYDSAAEGGSNPLAAMVGGMFKPMIGAKITQVMTNRGKVLEVNIPEAALAGLKSNPLAGQMISKEALQDLTGKAALELPAELDKGDSWSTTVNTKTPAGSLTIETTFTYEGEEVLDNMTVDKISTVIKVKAEGNALITDHKGSGMVYFDSAAGRLIKMTTKQSQKVNALGQMIDQIIDTTMTFKPVGK